MSLTGKVKIKPHEWKGILNDAFVWIDYAGVSQKEAGDEADGATAGSDAR